MFSVKIEIISNMLLVKSVKYFRFSLSLSSLDI